VEFAPPYGNCFNKPYFQPYFPNKTTLVAQNHQKTNLITLLNKEEQ
jgi:hypothetical protein